MVNIVAGYDGVSNTELRLNDRFTGSANTGQTLGRASINVANGSLSLNFIDESMAGSGADFGFNRSYSSMGFYHYVDDLDNDAWADGIIRTFAHTSIDFNNPAEGAMLYWLSGRGDLRYGDWDGTAFVFERDAGAHDRVTYSAANNELIWTDGDTNYQEIVDASTGKLKRTSDPHGNGLDYGYNADGTLRDIRDRRTGNSLSFGYENGKRTSISSNAEAGVTGVFYRYNEHGRLQHVDTYLDKDDASQIYRTTYEYDGDSDRILSVVQHDGTRIDITYENNKVKTYEDQNGRFTYSYDNTAQQTTITNAAGDQVIYSYDSIIAAILQRFVMSTRQALIVSSPMITMKTITSYFTVRVIALRSTAAMMKMAIKHGNGRRQGI